MFRNGLVCLAVVLAASLAHAAPPTVRLVDFEDVVVTGATQKRIIQAIDDAEQAGDSLVLIRMDTPGGLVDATERIIKRMLASEVPIVTWVGPSGAHAASAGFFLLIASDVAAMAPGTRTGAAAVIYGPGTESSEDDLGLKKAANDKAALLRSIAEHRGRNVEACERAVFQAEAFSEIEALELGLIELVAASQQELLEQLHGREITRFDGEVLVLATEGATLVTTEFDFRQRIAEIFVNPVVAYLLLMIGLAGLWVEFNNPGLIFPAVIGVASLILFAFAAQALPTSVAGLLLILLAIGLFVLEIKVTSFGMLTLGGAACLIGGSMLLFDGPIPELRVPWEVAIPVGLTVTATCVVVLRFAIRAQREAVVTGVEGLTGEIGTVTRALDPQGKVFVRGELWDARVGAGTVAEGQQVRVVEASDMTLRVEPADAPGQGGS